MPQDRNAKQRKENKKKGEIVIYKLWKAIWAVRI